VIALLGDTVLLFRCTIKGA